MEGQKSRGRGGVKFTSVKNSTVLRSKHYLWTVASIAFKGGIFSELTRFQMPLRLTGSSASYKVHIKYHYIEYQAQ